MDTNIAADRIRQTWPLSFNQLERFCTPNAPLRSNDYVRRELDIDGQIDLGRSLGHRRCAPTDPVLCYEFYRAGQQTRMRLSASSDLEARGALPGGGRLNRCRLREAARRSVRGGNRWKRQPGGSHRLPLIADRLGSWTPRSASLVFHDIFNAYARPVDRRSQQDLAEDIPWSFGKWVEWEQAHVARRWPTLTSFWRRKLESIGPFPEISLPTLTSARTQRSPAHIQPRPHDLGERGRARPRGQARCTRVSLMSALLKTAIFALRMLHQPGASTSVAAFRRIRQPASAGCLRRCRRIIANSAVVRIHTQPRRHP